jgi:4-hydroxybenzoyl-CoA thioesterase
MSSFVHQRDVRIAWGDCDAAGIVFYPRYLEMFDWSSWLLMEAALGVKTGDLFDTFAIAGFPLVGVNVRFHSSCRTGDAIVIESRVTSARRSSFQIAHRLLNGDTLAVECDETRVWATRDTKDATKLKSKSIPADVLQRLGLDVTNNIEKMEPGR